jgi:hypothetical protein
MKDEQAAGGGNERAEIKTDCSLSIHRDCGSIQMPVGQMNLERQASDLAHIGSSFSAMDHGRE